MASRKPNALKGLQALPQALVDSSADKRLDVLRQVAAGCSISQAAREVGISYKAAWQAIDTLSSLSGQPLVDRTVGGAGGGGAQITAQGQQLLALADALAQARQQVLTRFAGGRVLAAGLGLRTSMRNQLPCTVLRCEAVADDDPTVWVHAESAGGAVLRASVTRESADLLALEPGRPVLLLCKATAVIVATGSAPLESHDLATCRLGGKVERITAGGVRDEVVLALKGGGHWVGFAPHPFAARVGAVATASMGAASLVVALPE
ncbi:TOBE domain-containing protein [Hydrogenophaga sp. BPS33]|uniref:TOBE domain-containing protein n=1 Tax=Hydrogenophaga sp. BPS33 TaxID=2651974 RepID=UPI0013200FFF|nr:TOBE domain-containing protein [Hydrogenophaga sp. BPS33]QHE87008.1 LysR family transcriptional regulator [Hydrogenophaga sp. BPS33]